MDASADEERFVGNPLNSFLLIKRMTSDWKRVQEVLDGSNTSRRLLNNVTVGGDGAALKWPSDEDLSGAAQALVRLQVSQGSGLSQGYIYNITCDTVFCLCIGHLQAGHV